MTKQEAITLFNGVPGLAKAIGTTRQAIYQWPDDLDQAKTDRVNGAAFRLGKLPNEQAQTDGCAA
ncbi:MAG: Cro/CI family transcriptional regulator [Candidatus Thiodiazotropha lotti]|nr:Cro/CI family transcriptional regulator [Candidatus Thiodiazotropha lotti]